MKKLLAILLMISLVSPVFGAETVSKKITKGTAYTFTWDGRAVEEDAFQEAVRQSVELEKLKKEQPIKDEAQRKIFEADKKLLNDVWTIKFDAVTYEKDLWKGVSEKALISEDKWYNSKGLYFFIGTFLGAGLTVGVAYSLHDAYAK